MKFKPPLTLEEQVNHLELKKHVIFEEISKKEAADYLFEHNYINVISPFKYKNVKWLDGKSNKLVKDTSGNHVYERSVDFSWYINEHNRERSKYPYIMDSINRFENAYSTTFSYNVLHHYRIEDSSSFLNFFKSMHKKTDTRNYDATRKEKTHKEIHALYESAITHYSNVYNFFDSMTLGKRILVHQMLPQSLQSKIFKDLLECSQTLGTETQESFVSRLSILKSIRDCVYHCKSTTILIRYRNTRKNDLRTSTDMKKYSSLIEFLVHNSMLPRTARDINNNEKESI